MKHVIWLPLLLLFSCDGKDTITFEQYRDQHLKDHQAHLDLLNLHAPLIDTLFSQCLESLRDLHYPDQRWDTWKHVGEVLDKTLNQSTVYSHNVILNDATNSAAMQMWKAENVMNTQLTLLRDDIERGIRQHETTEEAIEAVDSLRETVRKQMNAIRKAEKVYQKACG